MGVKVKGSTKGEVNPLDKIIALVKGSDLDITDTIPYKRITKDGYLVDKNNQLQAFLRVKSNDLQSLNQADLEKLIDGLTTINRVYTEPFKILSTTYPSDTSVQQRFVQEKINRYRKQLVVGNITDRERKIIEKKRFRAMEELRRVKWVEDELKELAFFIVVYGKGISEIKESVRSMKRLGERDFAMVHIKKTQALTAIIRRLTNMNSEF